MEEMSVFIVNLGKYVEGKETGEWFRCPVDVDEVKGHLELSGDREEYAIHDYKLPFEIDEYINLEELNRLCGMVEEFDEPIQRALKELAAYYGGVEEVYEHKDDLIFYVGCDSPEDAAYYLVNDCGILGDISDEVRMYFDYEAYGRDLVLDEAILDTGKGIFGLLR